MTVTVEDIHRWDAGEVREIFNACRTRAEVAFEAADGLSELPVFGSWGGDAAAAAREAIGETRKDLDAHGNESLAVAHAAHKAADGIDKVKADLQAVEDEAANHGLQIDAAGGRVLPGSTIEGSVLDLLAVQNKMEELQARLDAIVAEAASVDDDLAQAIQMATGAEPIPDAPHESRPEIIRALYEGMPEDPHQFHELWDQLTDDEREWLYQQDRFIGNHPGMPFVDRDHFNRRTLTELTNSAQAEVDRLRKEHPEWINGPKTPNPNPPGYREWKQQWDAANHELDGFTAVAGELQRGDATLADNDPGNDLPRLLSVLDDDGHAAVSINDPDQAQRHATFVPGTGQDLARFEGSAGKSEDMYWAARDADASLAPSDVSVTTWMGYDRPMNLAEAASPSYAHNGADALSDFQAGLRASHDGAAAGPSQNTVVGHSYGSTLVGAAGLDGNHLDADNVIAVGSPGILADHASDLSLNEGANVYASRALNDIIGVATYATLGPDPMASGFGGIPFEAADGSTLPFGLPSVEAHSSYWDPGNPALTNMGRVIVGRTDITPPTFTP